MKDQATPIKADHRNDTDSNRQATGPNGASAAPPGYGIDFLDSRREPPNRTGLPDRLKTGIESLSGLSMDDVRVHYNSPKPDKLHALAYTQGTEIHVGPGHEKHLPHEAWHVVQQKQGRVRATMQMKGMDLNDDGDLEKEADEMGARILSNAEQTRGTPKEMQLLQDKPTSVQHTGPKQGVLGMMKSPLRSTQSGTAQNSIIQRVIKIKTGENKGTYSKPTAIKTKLLIKDLKANASSWSPGWIKYVKALVSDDENKPHEYDDKQGLIDEIDKEYKKISDKIDRPGFVGRAEKLGKVTKSLQKGTNQSGFKPGDNNEALPHRFSYADIRNSTLKFVNGEENQTDLERWSDRLVEATKKRKALNLAHTSSKQFVHSNYEKEVDEQIANFLKARTALVNAKASNPNLDEAAPEVQEFIKWGNSLHGNIPDYGPHQGVNVQVSNRLHPNFEEDGSMTPGTESAFSMTPHRVGKGYATTQQGGIVTTGGKVIPLDDYGSFLTDDARKLIERQTPSETSINDDDLEKMT